MENETMTIYYKIEFLDYWHLSSGLSAGAKLDSTVVKDKDGLPYLSGKTLKGLVREMAECLIKLKWSDKIIKLTLKDFQYQYNEFYKIIIFTTVCFGVKGVNMGSCYFSNATLSEEVADEIKKYNLQERLYDVIASTKIGSEDKFKNGKQIEKKDIAVDNSLREIEVVVPLTLEGTIDDVPTQHEKNMIKALKMIKRMGLNRNRGLGRCTITVEVA